MNLTLCHCQESFSVKLMVQINVCVELVSKIFMYVLIVTEKACNFGFDIPNAGH